jgi:hypothetical protein
VPPKKIVAYRSFCRLSQEDSRSGERASQPCLRTGQPLLAYVRRQVGCRAIEDRQARVGHNRHRYSSGARKDIRYTLVSHTIDKADISSSLFN